MTTNQQDKETKPQGDKPPQDNAGGPIVEVTNLNTNDLVKFHAKWEDTLQQALATAYTELKESPKAGDELLCEGGGSLMGYLNSTLAQLRDQKVCQNRKYQLRRATGGA